MFFIFPIGNERTVRFWPVFTFGVIAVCVAVSIVRVRFWSFFALDPWDPILLFGYRPDAIVSPNVVLYAFVHAGPMHLIGNMLFLWSVAASLEDRWGPRFFAAFYGVGALFSGLSFGLLHLGSSVPLVGATGAIAACMGAFLVAYPTTRLKFFYAIWVCLMPKAGTFYAKAYWVMPIWFLIQILGGYTELTSDGAGVAYSGHISGFALGAGVGLAIRHFGLDDLLQSQQADAEFGEGWTEDEGYVAALDLLAANKREAAVDKLQEVVGRLPRHLPSRLDLVRVLLERRSPGDDALIGAPASEAIELMRDASPEAALDQFNRVTGAYPDVELSERALFTATKIAAAKHQALPAIDAARRLMVRFPQSPAVPKVMWLAQEQQEILGKTEAQRRTLQNLLKAFPDDPMAPKARRKLAELERHVAPAWGGFTLPEE